MCHCTNVEVTEELWELGFSFYFRFQGSNSGWQAGSANAFTWGHLASPALSSDVVSEAILLSSAAMVLNLSPYDQAS